MLQIVLLAGKFVFLIVLYLFIYRVIRSTTRELRAAAPVTGRQQGFAPMEMQAAAVPTATAVLSARAEVAAWTLAVLRSPCLREGQTFSFSAGSHALVGRAPEMDIHLEDTFVSSKHALFEGTAAGLQVEDLRSTNGTQVNGEDISGPRVLAAADRVEVGDTVFVVEAR